MPSSNFLSALLLTYGYHTGIAFAISSPCSTGIYQLLAPLSAYPAAQSYCSKQFPPATITTLTTAATNTILATASVETVISTAPPSTVTVISGTTTITIPASEAPMKKRKAPSTTTSKTTSKPDPLATLLSNLEVQAKSVVSTFCSCIESHATQTIVSTPLTTTTSTPIVTSTVTPSTTIIAEATATCSQISNPSCGKTDACSDAVQCGSSGNSNCHCYISASGDGSSHCADITGMSCDTEQSCSSDADCGCDQFCASTCCGNVCLTPNACLNPAAKGRLRRSERVPRQPREESSSGNLCKVPGELDLVPC